MRQTFVRCRECGERTEITETIICKHCGKPAIYSPKNADCKVTEGSRAPLHKANPNIINPI